MPNDIFPSPLWGEAGVGVGRRTNTVDALLRAWTTPSSHLTTPLPTLPHKGGGLIHTLVTIAGLDPAAEGSRDS
jgi:hypothetical protein